MGNGSKTVIKIHAGCCNILLHQLTSMYMMINLYIVIIHVNFVAD